MRCSDLPKIILLVTTQKWDLNPQLLTEEAAISLPFAVLLLIHIHEKTTMFKTFFEIVSNPIVQHFLYEHASLNLFQEKILYKKVNKAK